MTDLPRPPTISYGSKGNYSQYNSDTPPPAAHISYKPEQVGEQYGWVTIISPEKRWGPKWTHCRVLTRCVGCGREQWSDLSALSSGKSKGCQACSQPRQIPFWLDRRLTAAKQRCENPNNQQFTNYGARGITFNFSSIMEAGLWILANVPDVKREYEMDRIDTNGNYACGNIRFVPNTVNLGNRNTTVLSEWDPQYWPYARSVVTRLLSAGMTRTGVIQSAVRAVKEKRKNWRSIEERLRSMTYEMPDQITVLPYRIS